MLKGSEVAGGVLARVVCSFVGVREESKERVGGVVSLESGGRAQEVGEQPVCAAACRPGAQRGG